MGPHTVPAMSTKKKELSFEEAMAKLEALVASMEAGDVPLATLVEKFEEGSQLELKIEKLRQEGESVALEPFAPEEA